MKQYRNENLFQFILAICSVIFISTQIGYAQSQISSNDETLTVVEFGSKSEQEQIKIVERLMLKGLKDVSSNVEDTGVPKSVETLERHRVMSKLIRSHFEKRKGRARSQILEIDPDATIQIRRYVNYSKGVNPKQLIWNVVVIYVKDEYEKLYTKRTDEWKKKFDSWTDEQQVAYFGAELKLKLAKEIPKVIDNRIAEIDKRLAELDKENKELEKKDRDLDKKIKDTERQNSLIKEMSAELKESSAYNVIKKLKVSFRASKTNPKKVILILKNETKAAARFNLKCNSNTNKIRTLPISMPANGIKEFGFIKGKGIDFILGEHCVFYYDSKRFRSLTIFPATNSDKSLSGTSWEIDAEYGIFYLSFAEEVVSFVVSNPDEDEADVELRGTYRKSGKVVFVDLPTIILEGTIKGNQIEIVTTYKKDNKKVKWVGKKQG